MVAHLPDNRRPQIQTLLDALADRFGGSPPAPVVENEPDDLVVVVEIARGLDRLGVVETIDDPAVKDVLPTSTASVVARGAFGVPIFFVGDEMASGHDRMQLAADALRV